MTYRLYYWPKIQGRGELVRLPLEAVGAKYVDVARTAGVPAMMKVMKDPRLKTPSFAPPFLQAGKLVIGQVANILLYLGDHHDLAPKTEAGRLWAHQVQLTITDFFAEVHDTHHPISTGLYYEDQKHEAKRRTRAFLDERLPKFLGWFEDVIARNGSKKGWSIGNQLTYVDTSLFQIVEGLRYAFPKATKKRLADAPRIVRVSDLVAAQPRVDAYLASDRRIAFNEDGIFRHYAELDE